MISRVVAANFLSWKSLNFEFKTGVTLVDGWNEDDQTPEGSGKSSIPNAVAWCLYGKLPKDANIDDVIKEGEKGSFVEVHFDDGTIVVRSRKPNDLTIVKNGNQVRGKDARETQAAIEEYVGLSFETFCQTIYFAQNYLKKFITSNQEEKGKILSEVQDLGVFDRAGKEVRALLKVEEESLTKLNTSLQLLAKDQELNNKDIQREELVIQNAFDRQAQQIHEIQVRIAEANQKIENAIMGHEHLRQALVALVYDESEEVKLIDVNAELMGQAGALSAKVNEIDRMIQKKMNAETQGKRYSARYKQLNLELEKTHEFIKNPSKNCPTCGTLLENCDVSHAEKDLMRISEEMTSIVETLTLLAQEIDAEVPTKEEINARLGEIRQAKAINDLRLKDLRTIKDKLTNGNANLKFFEQTCNTQQAEKERLIVALGEMSQPLTLDTSKLDKLKERASKLESDVQDVRGLVNEKNTRIRRLNELKDGFKEIKSYVFNSILNEVNARTQKYLSHLFEVPVSVRFRNEDMKIETDIRYDGFERGLGLLSGGQARRVGLAVDLALSDVITARKGSKIGFLILDEYFKDLSETSMEKCLTLLEGRGQPVLLIEHNSIFKNIVNNSVMVRLENGTSSVQV